METTNYIYGAVVGGDNQRFRCPRCKKQGEFPKKLSKSYIALNLICPCGCGMTFRFKDSNKINISNL